MSSGNIGILISHKMVIISTGTRVYCRFKAFCHKSFSEYKHKKELAGDDLYLIETVCYADIVTLVTKKALTETYPNVINNIE